MVPLVTVKRRAWRKPAAEISTAPILVMPRFRSRSPVLAHTTMARIMTRVLIRIRNSCPMRRKLIVSGVRWRRRHGDHGLIDVSGFTPQLPALAASLQGVGG